MLDREVVKEFLEEGLEDIEIPENISIQVLVETFCKYTENDYYEWLKDNFSSFFGDDDSDGPDWKWIKKQIQKYAKE